MPRLRGLRWTTARRTRGSRRFAFAASYWYGERTSRQTVRLRSGGDAGSGLRRCGADAPLEARHADLLVKAVEERREAVAGDLRRRRPQRAIGDLRRRAVAQLAHEVPRPAAGHEHRP